MGQELVFVYNADSGIFAGIKDLIHKSASRKTYGCNLCGLTYNGAFKKKDWQKFISRLPCTTRFLHKDEFLKQYPSFAAIPLPAVFSIQNQKITELIPASLINQQKTLEELKQLVQSKIPTE